MKADLEMVNNKKMSLGDSPNDSTIQAESKMHRFRDKVEKIIVFLNSITNKLSMIILFLLMVLTGMDVAGRNLLNRPITGTFELTGLGVALMVFFSLGTTQLKGEHISIDFLTNKLPIKIREILSVLVNCILLLLLTLTSWQLFEYTKNAKVNNQLSGDLSLPIYLFSFVGAIGILFYATTLVLSIINSYLKVVKR